MNRWIHCIVLAGAALAFNAPLGALAQESVIRHAPRDVKPALFAVTAPPEITLDGKADRLSPGARIRNERNLMVLSASLVGQTHRAVYRRDAAGLVHEVWLLTADEYAKVGGDDGSLDGHKRFAELLDAIFATRATLMLGR